MGVCKNCDHLVMDSNEVLYHYETKKGDELHKNCPSCDCERAEEK